MEATTWKWLNERTKGHTRQFDLIAWRSARRFEVEEQRSELARKREVVDRLLKDLTQTQKQLEEFRGQVRDIERNLEQSLAAAKHRIRDDSPAVSTKLLSLNQGLASARENLQGFEAAALAANEQAQILLLDLRTTEAKVCAHPHLSLLPRLKLSLRDAPPCGPHVRPTHSAEHAEPAQQKGAVGPQHPAPDRASLHASGRWRSCGSERSWRRSASGIW